MTTKTIICIIATLSVLSFTAPAFPQDGATAPLPDICTSKSAEHDMGAGSAGHPMGDMAMDQAHQDLMKGMDEMNAQMMKGMTASDIDVAFVCGMIPHHRGAISMAKAELAHGKDEWAKKQAQMIIDAQEKEIAEMTVWLDKQPK